MRVSQPASDRSARRAGRHRRHATGRPPLVLGALATVGAAFLLVPFVGLAAETPWSDLATLIGSPEVVDALRLSLTTSIASALISGLLGVPLAWVLSRADFRGKVLLRATATLPMVLPPVVGGAALLFALGRRGLLGQPIYNQTGWSLPFSTTGVVIASTFVAMPFVVITVEGALSAIDPRYEAAAASLGAGPFTVFRRVALPMIGPSLRAGLILAWARALGEFGATVTFAGNLPGRTQTMPLAVAVALDQDRDTAVALSVLMVLVSFSVLVILRRHWWPAR